MNSPKQDEKKWKETGGEQKEGFCGACLAGVGALLGAGTSAYSSKIDKKKKKTIFWAGVAVSVISILILIVLLIKGCKDCA